MSEPVKLMAPPVLGKPIQREAEDDEPLQMRPQLGLLTPVIQREADEDEPIQMMPQGGWLQRLPQEAEDEEPIQMKPQLGLIQRQQAEDEEPIQMKPQLGLIQRQEVEADEEPVQMKPQLGFIQRQEADADEEPLQMKPQLGLIQRQEVEADEEPIQMKPQLGLIQRQEAEADEEPIQMKPQLGLLQRQEAEADEEPIQMKPQLGLIQRQEVEADEEPLQMQRIQLKVVVGQPGDKYEQEADSVAAQVMSMSVPPTNSVPIQRQGEEEEQEPLVQRSSLADSITPLVQRQTEEQEEPLQAKSLLQRAGNGNADAGSNVESQLNSSKGGGSPLPDEVRSFMEPRFGVDFSAVRVHTGSSAVQMNKDLHAQAFTHGSDIYYGSGKSAAKDDLTAHELTHVVQQTGAKKLQRKPVTRVSSNKEILQRQEIPAHHLEITQNKQQGVSSGIGWRIQAKADPGQILEQLKNTPPTSAPAGYDQAQAASAGALEAQKQELQQSLPKIPAPTGLPPQKSGSKETQAKGIAASGNKETPTAGGTKEKSGQGAKASKIEVKEAPPPRPIKPTQLAGGNGGKPVAGNSDAKTEQAANSDPQLSQSAQKELASVRLDTSQVSTTMGAKPTVDLTGEADPSQMDSEQRESSKQVSAAKVEAAKEINKDFGENNIFPEDSKETLQATKALSAAQAPAGKKGKVPVVPSEVMGSLNQSLAPVLKERIGVQQQKYTVGKQKFDKDTAQAKKDSDKEIAKLNQETSQKQLEEQKQAKAEVQASKQEWQTELTKAEKDYQDKAGKATQDQKKKIDQEKQKGEQDATKHIEEAEQKAEQEKQKAESEASQKKEEKSKESGGFWGWVASAATAVIDGLKQAVNFIYDNLRKAVKAIFEAAKQLAMAAIDLARKAIVGLIEGLGTILKGLVNVVFAAFPEIAKKINSKIDKAIDKAVNAVNTAADLLKKSVAAALDFLANTLDSLLGLIQSIYNGIFTVIGMIVRGEFEELMKRLGNLVDAAKAAPPQFETAGYEELLGGNFDEPLSPAELAQAGIAPPGAKGGDSGQVGSGSTDEMPKPPWSEANIGVDAVDPNMELSPELSAELLEKTKGEGEVEIGAANDNGRSMDSVMSEVTSEKQSEGKEQKYPDDGLSPRQRAEVRWKLMKAGISQWWSNNWPKVLIGATAAIGGFIALNVVTGGAITAALPAIMSVVGPLFVGVTIAQIGGHVRDYLAKGWEGDIQGGGKSLAKGLAAGAIELISYLTFKAGGAAIKGAKALVKGGVKLAKGTINLIAKGVKFIIEKGKVLFKGIAGSALGKGFQRLRQLGEALLERMRFKKFRIRIERRQFLLEGYINPWVVVARGQITEVPEGTKNAVFKTDDELRALKEAEKAKTGKLTELEVAEYQVTKTQGKGARGVTGDKLTGDHIPSRAALFENALEAEKAKLGRDLTAVEKKLLNKRINDEGITVVLKDTTHAELSRTYAGRNTAAQIAEDAKDLGKAFGKDAEAILKGLYDDRKLTNEVVGAYLEAYRRNVRKGVFEYSADIDEMLIDFLKRTQN
jgi:hypothetical protein